MIVVVENRALKLLSLLLLLVGVASGLQARTVEPRKIQSSKDLKSGEGALLLSIRHQTPIAWTMHVRFESVDDPTQKLKFERKVGMGGLTRMLERQVQVYAVPAGKWRLASHLVGCDADLEAGQGCVVHAMGSGGYSLPAATYEPDWFIVDVPDGGFTDAGELNLEFSTKVAAVAVESKVSPNDISRLFRFRHRRILPANIEIPSNFGTLKHGSVAASEPAISETTCEKSAKSLKLPFNPLKC